MRNQKSGADRLQHPTTDQGARGRGEPRRGRPRDAEAPSRNNNSHRAGGSRPDQQAGGPEHRGISGHIDKNP